MQELEDLKQDALNIASLGNHLIEAIKERDSKIKELELRLEEIGRV